MTTHVQASDRLGRLLRAIRHSVMRSAMRRFRQKFSCTSGGTGQNYSTIFRYSAGTTAVAEICVWNQLAETIAGTLAEPRWCECHGRSGPGGLPSNASCTHVAPGPPSTIPRRSRQSCIGGGLE